MSTQLQWLRLHNSQTVHLVDIRPTSPTEGVYITRCNVVLVSTKRPDLLHAEKRDADPAHRCKACVRMEKGASDG